jgi:hypothetical protein
MDLVAGDHITVSIEKISDDSFLSYTLSRKQEIDIEDILKAPQCDISNVEPHVASGTVLQISTECLIIGFQKLSKRLRRYVNYLHTVIIYSLISNNMYSERMVSIGAMISSKRISSYIFRVDKEEFTASLTSVLRYIILI